MNAPDDMGTAGALRNLARDERLARGDGLPPVAGSVGEVGCEGEVGSEGGEEGEMFDIEFSIVPAHRLVGYNSAA